ncbi:MAG: ABC transporter substrate-binding protein [Candidatus Rokuibacteriota bacterium]|nr:MAG: ABC transporter substrate-binding protein [Candidatus Rokubacteria bacterium]
MQCARCQQSTPADALFCPKCGAKLSVGCPQCETPAAADDSFCRKCGQRLARAPAQTPGATRFASPDTYTPKHLAERILISRAALQGERKQVTVLFKVPATLGKLLAMFESGNIELDVVDAGELGMISLSQKGALDKITYKAWKLSNPDDFDAAIRRDDMVCNIYFSSVLGYNSQVFATGKQPRSWAEFWDIKKFPGPRMLADLASGNVDLEFALLADGVARDKLYPIDIERAFKSLDRVRPAIRKFWDTGALSAQMLADKEVVLGSIWNGRLQAVADKGAPLAIEWNEASLQTQYWGVLKGAKSAENAQRFIDFACQPEIQANFAKLIPYGPSNRQAFKSIPADVAARLPSSPEHKATAFLQNGKWWADNRAKISERWSQWLLQKG